jgi:pentatricopeptide repeat protein
LLGLSWFAKNTFMYFYVLLIHLRTIVTSRTFKGLNNCLLTILPFGIFWLRCTIEVNHFHNRQFVEKPSSWQGNCIALFTKIKDMHTYTVLIDGFCKCWRLKNALEVFKMLLFNGYHLDVLSSWRIMLWSVAFVKRACLMKYCPYFQKWKTMVPFLMS